MQTTFQNTEHGEPISYIDMPAPFLRANSEAYEWLVEKIRSIDLRKNQESVLDGVVQAAQFAVMYHPGRFADGAIENLALRIGIELDELEDGIDNFTIPEIRKQRRRRVLHVASHVQGIGGHTRMIYHWVRNDQTSCHSLVIVDQKNIPIPEWLNAEIRRSGGVCVSLPSMQRLSLKAKWLRKIANNTADLVVLHTGAFDVVPTVAFAIKDCPPIAKLNNDDHLFWLGSTVSDIVINLRTAGAEHTEKRRFVTSNTVIPIPLIDPSKHIQRNDAKNKLNIPEDQIMLLSVGRGEKYRPSKSFDFVATAGKILKRKPNAQLYVIGESFAGIKPYLRCAVHDRLHFLGSIEDPSLYRFAADVYLESFPFGSQTALLEAALSGLPVVSAYAPLFELLVANDDAIQDIITNPVNEQEYVNRVELLIENVEKRTELGNILRKRLLVDHVGKGWQDRLNALYKITDELTHKSRTIPKSMCSRFKEDVSLSLWHVMADGKTFLNGDSFDELSTLLRHSAFVHKHISHYSKARSLAWRAIHIDPFSWSSWRLLMVTLLGKSGRFFRNTLSCFN